MQSWTSEAALRRFFLSAAAGGFVGLVFGPPDIIWAVIGLFVGAAFGAAWHYWRTR